MMRSCLKSPPPTPGVVSPGTGCKSSCRKSVAFFPEGSDELAVEIFDADDWDRTPAEVAHKLSYQDVLELKEIQRSLPRANQFYDPHSRLPQSHLLSAVPIGLLPLLPDDSSSSSNSSTCGTTDNSKDSSPMTSISSSPSSSAPPSPAFGTPTSRPPLRPFLPRPKFAFLPLLETPPEPKTFAEFEAQLEDELSLSTPSLTSPSLDSPSSSPELGYFDIPTRRNDDDAGSSADDSECDAAPAPLPIPLKRRPFSLSLLPCIEPILPVPSSLSRTPTQAAVSQTALPVQRESAQRLSSLRLPLVPLCGDSSCCEDEPEPAPLQRRARQLFAPDLDSEFELEAEPSTPSSSSPPFSFTRPESTSLPLDQRS